MSLSVVLQTATKANTGKAAMIPRSDRVRLRLGARSEVMPEAGAPRRIAQDPSELPLRFVIRGARNTRHHVNDRLAHHQPGEPLRNVPGRLRAHEACKLGKPNGRGRGFIVHDLIDAARSLLDGERSGQSNVLDMNERPHTAPGADDRKSAPS